MGGTNQNSADCKPALELIAKGIGDPVVRLRFLKYVAPEPKVAEGNKRAWRVAYFAIPAILLSVLTGAFLTRSRAAIKVQPAPTPQAAIPVVRVPQGVSADVWKVEDSNEFETYSNGLRIDKRFVVSNHPRSYLVFPAGDSRAERGVPGRRPAGIVFHTTESRQAPFEERRNGELQRIGESLIQFVQRRRSYNFLIDRFGRVYRIVAENDAANHAGYSVWADDTSLYINLNESFLGVSFEAETQPGQMQPSVSTAQIRAAAMLTEMLRKRYAIPAANCVTHAQVSVNPSNMRVGYHTDWASSFPFEELDLPNNYTRPSAAIAQFGFQYDSSFLHWAGTQLYSGVESGEREIRESARRSHLSLDAYRKALQNRYRQRLAAMRQGPAALEVNDE